MDCVLINKWQIRRYYVHIIIILLLVVGLWILLFPLASPVQTQSEHVKVHFTGPDFTHVTYHAVCLKPCELEFSVVLPSGDRWVFDSEEQHFDTPPHITISGEHRHPNLSPGNYVYETRRRSYDKWTDTWSDWETRSGDRTEINGVARGTLYFDDTIEDAELHGVFVPDGKTLTVSGTLTGRGGAHSDLYVHGTLAVPNAVTMSGVDSKHLSVSLYSDHHLTKIIGGRWRIHPEVQNASFTDSIGISVYNFASGHFIMNYVQNSYLMATGLNPSPTGHNQDQIGLNQDQIVEINNSNLLAASTNQMMSCSAGKLVFNNTVVDSRFDVRGSCSVMVNDTTFNNRVRILAGENVLFESVGSSFHDRLDLESGDSGKLSFVDTLFSDTVYITYKSSPTFSSCEFLSLVMRDRNGAFIENSLFLRPIFIYGASWDLESSPSPTIQNNAFMGQAAFYWESAKNPVSIGQNYYGDQAGFYRDDHGFLGYHSGHAGALDLSAEGALDIAPHLETSPVSGARRNSRLLPRFWVNGYIFGQNTLNHDGSSGPLIKGRDTLVSVHLVASDNNLQGVRVYARWDGQVIEAANNRNNLPLHRDHSLYSNSDVRRGLVTYNFILPGVDDGSTDTLTMSVEVYLDVSGLSGFDAEAYPEEDRQLFSRGLNFTTFKRPLRIAVQPLEVLGYFYGTYGVANPAGVMEVLRTDLPDMLPIPADKVELTQLPTSRISLSPYSFVNVRQLLNYIASGLNLRNLLSTDKPDFTVLVLPHGLTGNYFDGVTLAFNRRILYVVDRKPDAVLHEMGHGVGLYTGWGNEQYDLHPPNGLLVERVTRFSPEGGGPWRIDHLPGAEDFWYDLPDDAWYYLDIMGRIGPVWTIPETVQSFHNWFKFNLHNTQASGPSTTPAAAPNTRRTLITAFLDRTEVDHGVLMPGTVWNFDVTELDFPEIFFGMGEFTHELIAFDSEGKQITSLKFGPPSNYTIFTQIFTLPDRTVSFCINYFKNFDAIIHCTAQVGLQSTTLLSPLPGDTIGPQFEAEWVIEADPDVNQNLSLTIPNNNTAVIEAQLLHFLYYKTAPDGPWQFGLMTQETDISVSSSFLPDTDYLALRLLSSDGLTRTEHVVEGLKVAPRPPQVTIFSPQDGDQSTANILWQLSANAEDFSGKGLQPGRWHSSIQGDLGQGPVMWQTLTTGTHVLSYEVLSNNGLKGTSSVTVTVHDKMTSLDLGLAESDLTLHNASTDPAGYMPQELIPGEVNTFTVRLHNQGVDASARVHLFVQGPEDAQDVLIGEQNIILEPFEIGYHRFDFEPAAIGIYKVRVLIDQVTPSDPDMSNNERTWTFAVAGYQNGEHSKFYLPLIIQGP